VYNSLRRISPYGKSSYIYKGKFHGGKLLVHFSVTNHYTNTLASIKKMKISHQIDWLIRLFMEQNFKEIILNDLGQVKN